jgi:DNA-directed RNA polymerase specialized sigma24 family protein
MPEDACRRPTQARFNTTHWSVVLAAGRAEADDRERALEALCRVYWYPIYAFLRRLRHPPADAQDLTQGFFAYLLEVELLARASPESGRFRSYLLGCLQRWLSNLKQRRHTLKRGAGRDPIALDALSAEERYALEPVTEETPAAQFERAWAEALVGETLRRLEAEHEPGPDRERFRTLRPALLDGQLPGGYAEVARALGIGEGAVKVAVHRLRRRFGQLLRAGVAETVADPGEVDAELRHLLRVLGR